MSGQPELRIGDAERESAASALGEHFAHGRITREEYDERSAAIWAARTASDLRPQFADLPGPHPAVLGAARRLPVGGPARGTVSPPRPARRGFRIPVLPLILVVLGVALLTDGWTALLLVGVLWWVFVFRVLYRVAGYCRSHGVGPPGGR